MKCELKVGKCIFLLVHPIHASKETNKEFHNRKRICRVPPIIFLRSFVNFCIICCFAFFVADCTFVTPFFPYFFSFIFGEEKKSVKENRIIQPVSSYCHQKKQFLLQNLKITLFSMPSSDSTSTSSIGSSSSHVDQPPHHHDHNRVTAPFVPRDSDEDNEKIDAPPVPWMHGFAGILGGSISMTLFYPLDILRTRMHTYDDRKRHKPLDDLRSLWKQEGMKGMYKGVKVAVVAHSVGWGLYLTFFRFVQQNIAAANGGTHTSMGDFAAACCAATATATMVTPLNLVKTRTQLAKGVIPDSERGFGKTLRRVVAQEGWRSLFRGVGPQILLASHTTIQVALYEFLKRRLWGDHAEAPMMGVACASGFSKAIAATVCNPLEVVRTRLQDKANREKPEYRSMKHAFRHIWQNEGMSGLYRGIGVNVCRVVPTTVVAFVCYEKCLRVIHLLSKPKPAVVKRVQE